MFKFLKLLIFVWLLPPHQGNLVKLKKKLGKPSKQKFGESWDIVATGRGGTLSIHISVPNEKITCSEWLRTNNKVKKYF